MKYGRMKRKILAYEKQVEKIKRRVENVMIEKKERKVLKEKSEVT